MARLLHLIAHLGEGHFDRYLVIDAAMKMRAGVGCHGRFCAGVISALISGAGSFLTMCLVGRLVGRAAIVWLLPWVPVL